MLETQKKYKILIVDDSDFNRLVMTSMLAKDYLLEEARDGREAVLILQDRAEEFSLVLLDIVMPNMNGFQFLRVMRECGWLEFLPVIMISSEYTPDNIDMSYQLGARDLIQRPYDERVVCHRIANTIALFSKQRALSNALMDEVIQENENSAAMVSILSHIVETRNGESGAHVQNIRAVTGMLLEQLQKVTDRYPMTQEEMLVIVTASSLHDIGKMSVPEDILNKPGKLTDEEFRIIKGHSMAGADMVEPLLHKENASPLIRMAYEICRWHHERYDGRGYPDGLKGEEIPIAAQVVSLADVYDALTSVRCYKPAHPPEKALRMILDGQCGVFNPLLLDCLTQIFSRLKDRAAPEPEGLGETAVPDPLLIADVLEHSRETGLFSSDKIMQTLHRERLRSKFFFNEPSPVFFYSLHPPVLHMNKACRELFGVENAVIGPNQTIESCEGHDPSAADCLRSRLAQTSNEQPLVTGELLLRVPDDRPRRFRCVMQTIWDSADTQHYEEVVGRLIPLEEGEHGTPPVRETEESFPAGSGTMTGREAWHLINALRVMVYNVRLVDPSDMSVVLLDSSGNLSRGGQYCYEIWRQDHRCENCTSLKCQQYQKEFAKIVFSGSEVFYVASQYVKVNGRPLVLEMLTRITDDALIDGSGRKLASSSISDLRTKLYQDSLTNAYNRRYYYSRVQSGEPLSALAVVNVDHFNRMSDAYGRTAGESILKTIAEAIRDFLSPEDALVRYGGNDFLLLFDAIDRAGLERTLRAICNRIPALRFDGVEGEPRATVSIGGAMGPGLPDTLIRRADEMLQKAKRVRGAVELWPEE